MDEGEKTDGLAGLEAARDQLETVLRSNAQWHALRADSGEPAGPALANNPLYKSWVLINEAIADLRSTEVAVDGRDAGLVPAAGVLVVTRDSRPQDGDGQDPLDRPREADRGSDRSNVNQSAADPIAAPDGEQEPVAIPGREPADDLTRIHGIDEGIARTLVAVGVTRYADIAAWRREDVHRIAAVLGLTREISQQNWIEQAALLDRREHDASAAPSATADTPAAEILAETARPTREPDISLNDILEAIRRDASAADGETAPTGAETPVSATEVTQGEQTAGRGSGKPSPAASVSATSAPHPKPAADDAADDDVESALAAQEVPEAASASDGDVEPAAEQPASTISMTRATPATDDDEAQPPIPVADMERPEPAPDGPEPAVASVEPVAATPSLAPASQARARIPTVAASSHVNTDAMQRVRRLEEERLQMLRDSGHGDTQRGGAADEADVSFIVRESWKASRLGTDVSPPSTGAHLDIMREGANAPEPYVAARSLPEEAEVVVVTPHGPSGDQPAQLPAPEGTVRRLVRSLTGR